ncbi:putative glutathione S-transferase-related protein [Sulfitobacter noctilucicola]|uniref:Glutathione S-transferase n=1 Tax=Sulfitobacter noctilucicola TaxID=1342301 RepID=A0A7W6Q6Y4_9RHOB|nr:glutathione S-transferase [Sulfitobacter noctilucicola]KIN63986.1 putative glutathione S-transferase-related protein [Sulfitobacter noctilucicola]MBB4175342.1 glutathione S-transferase [Sulfitobacter noctilucicola]
MTDLKHEHIFHAYPQSPVAEKVRVAFGIKGLAWRSVDIPRLPPKPMLTALTGGYRRTPVLQIGADIYCDSQCIIRELERRFPLPSFFPTKDEGLMWCLSRWTDGTLFDQVVRHVLGAAGDNLDKHFAADRGRLYLGEDWAAGLKKANADLPHLVSQLRAPLTWLNAQMADGRAFLLGNAPAAIDAQIYHVVWFLRGRWAGGPSFLSEFAELERWEANIQSIGHGTSSNMSAEDAITVAKKAEPLAIAGVAAHDPQGLEVGQEVTISPDVNGGEQPVAGKLRFADAQTVVIDRTAEDVGNVCVHFPRAGYRVDLS